MRDGQRMAGQQKSDHKGPHGEYSVGEKREERRDLLSFNRPAIVVFIYPAPFILRASLDNGRLDLHTSRHAALYSNPLAPCDAEYIFGTRFMGNASLEIVGEVHLTFSRLSLRPHILPGTA